MQGALNVLLKREDHDAAKPAVIGIAATATVVVVALICGLLFWFLRRRKRRNLKGHNATRGVAEEETTSFADRNSKTPLMRMEGRDGSNPTMTSNEDDDITSIAPGIPRRTPSLSSVQSLPPSYTAAVRASRQETSNEDDITNQRSGHRPTSSMGGSDGLRPLLLVNAHSRSNSPERGESRLAVIPQRPVGRPQSISRFREEDVDS